MSQSHYDVVVVGGGINGVGTAQAVAAAGHTVLVLEKTDLAHGTSGKSTKLIHGGLRYLENFEWNLVREGLVEREILLRNAPDIVKLQNFYLPIYAATRRQPLLVRTGLSIYALLGGLRPANRFTSVPRSGWDKLDGLNTNNLKRVFQYKDGQTDDRALTRAVMRSAQALGANLETPAELVQAKANGKDIHLDYLRDGKELACTAKVLVNAAGPWVNRVAQRILPAPPTMEVSLVQGTHLELPLPTRNGIYYMESRRDGRGVFVTPWGEKTLVGTTETRFLADPDESKPLASERSYLTAVVEHYFPKFRKLGDREQWTAWSGLRVLPSGRGHAFHKSRETVLLGDNEYKPRVLSIYGGKLTAYRSTAQRVLERISGSLPRRKPRADTRRLKLSPVD